MKKLFKIFISIFLSKKEKANYGKKRLKMSEKTIYIFTDVRDRILKDRGYI